MTDILAWLLARLADFQRVIEYFGIGAIFVWLYFLERGDRVKASEGQQAQEHIDTITKYYQTSWVFFGVAVLAEYALSEEWLTKQFGTFAFTLVNYIAIIFGLAMFTVPSAIVYRKIGGHMSYGAVSVPEVADVFSVVLFALIHTVLLYGMTGTGVVLNAAGQVLAATFGLSYFGILASLKWGNAGGWRSRLVFTVAFLPWILICLFMIQDILSVWLVH